MFKICSSTKTEYLYFVTSHLWCFSPWSRSAKKPVSHKVESQAASLIRFLCKKANNKNLLLELFCIFALISQASRHILKVWLGWMIDFCRVHKANPPARLLFSRPSPSSPGGERKWTLIGKWGREVSQWVREASPVRSLVASWKSAFWLGSESCCRTELLLYLLLALWFRAKEVWPLLLCLASLSHARTHTQVHGRKQPQA